MIKIKMQTLDGIKEYDACKVLQHINASETIVSLQAMEWHKDGKKRFLMGDIFAMSAVIDEPLSIEDARQAINEYNKLIN